MPAPDAPRYDSPGVFRQGRLTGAVRLEMLEGYPIFPPESLAIPKRKPPSQRPERKLDETARAIARALEGESAEKSDATQRPANTTPLLNSTGRDARTGNRQAFGGPPPSPSTKRPKQP